MHFLTNQAGRCFASTLLLIAAMFCSGCAHVVWLPDSSGLVYTHPKTHKTQLLRFAKKAAGEKAKPVELASAKGFATLLPAVSPDGKQVAIVNRVPAEDGKQFVVEFFDLSGKSVKTSKPMAIPKDLLERQESRKEKPMTGYLLWSPTGKHLLLELSVESEEGQSLIYNFERDEFLPLHETAKTGLAQMAYFLPPLVPDGSGFLCSVRGKDEKPEECPILFVNWDGKVHHLKMPAEEIKALQGPGGSSDERQLPSPGSWEMNVASFETADGVLRIDPRAGRANFTVDEEVKKRHAEAKAKDIRHRATFADGKWELQSRNKPGDDTESWIELVNTRTKDAKILVAKATIVGYYRSPNGQFMAITYAGGRGEGDMYLLVINSAGETVYENAL